MLEEWSNLPLVDTVPFSFKRRYLTWIMVSIDEIVSNWEKVG